MVILINVIVLDIVLCDLAICERALIPVIQYFPKDQFIMLQNEHGCDIHTKYKIEQWILK